MDEPPFKGFVPEQPPVRLKGKGRFRRVIDAGNRGRDMMRKNKGKGRRDQTGKAARRPVAAPPVDTAEQRETVRRGLRVLAKIIARAHLRRQAARCIAAPGSTNGEPLGSALHGPPPERKVGGVSDSAPQRPITC